MIAVDAGGGLCAVGGGAAADAADEAHRSWARREPFWDAHAAERRWAERGRKDEDASPSEGVQS